MREPVVPQLSASQFIDWESQQRERFELQNGYVFAFAGGTIDHDQIGFNVRTAFAARFPRPCRSFGPEMKVRVSESKVYYADAGVVCEPLPGDTIDIAAPLAIAEVLSPSTRAFDLVEKRAAYRTVASLKLLLIVHTNVRRVEVDRRDANGAWQTEVVDSGEIFIGDGSIGFERIYDQSSLTSDVG